MALAHRALTGGLLFRRAVAPAYTRSIVGATEGNFGKMLGQGSMEKRLTQQKPLGVSGFQGKQGPGAPSGTSMHHRALQRLAEYTPFEGSASPLQAYRDRSVRLRQNRDRRQQEEVFEESRRFLMEPERWTFGNMAAYQRKVLELMGATGWRRRFTADDPSITHLEKELKVLEAMTPVELMSNHKRVFTHEAKKLIAEKSGTTEKFVEQVFLEHDILRADRKWYMIREQFGKPLPKSFEDRQLMAEYDRPYSETEAEMRDEMVEKQRKSMSREAPKRLHHIFYRHPTCGGNRWSIRPPKWYPVGFRMRGERKQRLAGVGLPGGGGDRGKPWGRLAQFMGPGR